MGFISCGEADNKQTPEKISVSEESLKKRKQCQEEEVAGLDYIATEGLSGQIPGWNEASQTKKWRESIPTCDGQNGSHGPNAVNEHLKSAGSKLKCDANMKYTQYFKELDSIVKYSMIL